MSNERPRRTLTLLPDNERVDGTGLFQLGEREIYTDLGELGGRMVFLGADSSCHVQVDDPYISRRQAVFVRERGIWTLTPWMEAHNPTYLDGALLAKERRILRGSVVRAGCVAWLVTAGVPKTGEFFLRARSLLEFCVAAYRAYGSTRRAAEAVGMSDRTFRRRLSECEEGRELLIARRPQPRRRRRRRHPCDPFGIPLVSGRDESQGEEDRKLRQRPA